jgi:hypothetical protein
MSVNYVTDIELFFFFFIFYFDYSIVSYALDASTLTHPALAPDISTEFDYPTSMSTNTSLTQSVIASAAQLDIPQVPLVSVIAGVGSNSGALVARRQFRYIKPLHSRVAPSFDKIHIYRLSDIPASISHLCQNPNCARYI